MLTIINSGITTSSTAPVCTTVPVVVLRGKQKVTLKVLLTEQPDTMAAVARPRNRIDAALGMTVQDLTAELANKLGYKGEKGVVVGAIDPKGPAAKATPTPIRKNDLIQELDQKPVTTLLEFRQAVAQADVKRGILMLVRSPDGARRFVVVKKK